MIAGGHVVGLKLERHLHSQGHKNVEESAKRNITKCKTGPHPLAKHGLHWQDQELCHCSAGAADRSVSFQSLKNKAVVFLGSALGGPLHSFLRGSSGCTNVKISTAK